MSIELLSSEIFFEIFDFLDDIDILHSFHNLNDRFNDLLLTYFRVSPRLNLQSMTKSHFNTACRYVIPFIADNIHVLRLSNDGDTPQQIDLFLSYGLSLHQFPHLKSLSLHYMHSESIINRMMIEWQYPTHLTHLNITNCRVLSDWNIVYTLINNIWSLPKLTHCQLDIQVIDEVYSIVPTVISPTLEYLSIKNMHCALEELVSLFEHTPRLQYLDITVNERNFDRSYLSFSVPSMTTLKLIYEGPLDVLVNLLQSLPNLRNWTMRTIDVDVTGEQWAEIISNYLPKLKNFHLLMQLDYERSYHSFSELIYTYKSDFWLKEHQWFIRGHYYSHGNGGGTVFLHTLPYTFNVYPIPFTDTHLKSESPRSNIDEEILYKHVHHLFCTSLPLSIYQIHHRFDYIYHLSLKLPFNDNFWTLVPTFDQLRILDISFSHTEAYDEGASFQLQTLLDQAPKLRLLTFQSSIHLVLPLLECTSESIVKLDLQNCGEYFHHSDCAILSLTTLGKQCKILSIKVTDRMNIPQLIQEMPQLQTLTIELPPGKYKTDNDQLVTWLRRTLSPACIITRDVTHTNRIQLWIE